MDERFINPPLFSEALNERVQRVQGGKEKIDGLISEYKPFILSTVQKCACKGHITEADDEYSIALIAFAEAVNAYQANKGNFLAFAKNIIRMRCIDYYRKEKKHLGAMSLYDIGEKDAENDLSYKQALSKYETDKINNERALEIMQFKEELAGWDISFADLARVSPKQVKTREMCREVICFLINDEKN